MRAFIAIDLTPQVIAEIQRIQKEISGRIVPPEKLHLTMAFFADLKDPDTVTDLLSVEPFTIHLTTIGNFSDLIWIGAEGEELLAQNQKLREKLLERNIPFDAKLFLPHITIARHAELRKDVEVKPIEMPVTKYVLYESDYRHYTKLAEGTLN